MAKSTLPVNYKDDILNNAMSGKRRYRMINNSDGTVSLEDVTTYDQVGSNFGAGQMNATNEAVNQSLDANKLIKDLDTIGALTEEGYAPDALAVKELSKSLTNEDSETFNFGVKDGVRGFFTNPSRADDSFVPFKVDNHYIIEDSVSGNGTRFFGKNYTAPRTSKYMIIAETISQTGNLWRYYWGVNGAYNYDYNYIQITSQFYFVNLNEGDILSFARVNNANADGTTYAKFHIIDWEY